MIRDEGYIKFELQWEQGPPPNTALIKELNQARTLLHQQGLIGIYPDGIGFGNVSVKHPYTDEGLCIISGTATGGISTLEATHYTTVIEADTEQNFCRCCGPVKASSETLTHMAVYNASEEIGAVLHIHDLGHWERLCEEIPCTPAQVPYGTPEMAIATQALFQYEGLASRKIFAMKGHEEGIVAFGKTVAEAVEVFKAFEIL